MRYIPRFAAPQRACAEPKISTKDHCKFRDNYHGRKRAVVLPSGGSPILLVTVRLAIAVGMAPTTSRRINPGEVSELCLAYIEDPSSIWSD